jgi:hypothetical protein
VSEKVKLMSKVQSSTSKHVLWKASQLLWSRETSYSAYISCQNLLKRWWFKTLVLKKLMTCMVVDRTSCRIVGRVFDTSAVYASCQRVCDTKGLVLPKLNEALVLSGCSSGLYNLTKSYLLSGYNGRKP